MTTFQKVGFNVIKAGLVLAMAFTTLRAEVAAGTKFYVEPAAVVAFPGDFDTAAGAALTAGISVYENHQIEAEVIWFKSGEGIVDVKFMPMLATYKYRMPLSPNLAVKFGGSVGATSEKASVYWYSESKTAFTYGVVGGLSYALTPKLSLDANALVLRLEETTIATAGAIEIVTVGVNYRF